MAMHYIDPKKAFFGRFLANFDEFKKKAFNEWIENIRSFHFPSMLKTLLSIFFIIGIFFIITFYINWVVIGLIVWSIYLLVASFITWLEDEKIKKENKVFAIIKVESIVEKSSKD